MNIRIKATALVGELCNFMLGAVFSALAGYLYKHHKSRKNAIIGAKGKGTQQGRQVREVHLDEGRDEHRERELDEHQDKGHRAGG